MDEKCVCGEFRRDRCVDCGSDLHAPAPPDCDNYHHEFEPAAPREGAADGK